MMGIFGRKEKFYNEIPTIMDTRLRTTISILRDFIKGNPNGKPSRPIPMDSLGLILRQGGQTKVTWMGHSALLLEMDGKIILLDPMFGRSPSPVPLFGSKRYSGRIPFDIEDLPPIDAIIYSHDHYDHLDYSSVKKLKDKAGKFFVPIGVGSHLVRWGVDQRKVQEFSWWDECEFDGFTLACTPARHFSGRGLWGRDTTLWCSWVIRSKNTNIFFSGDSGYGPHFEEIGNKYGPFDLTLIECGQYDERWSAIHMVPEETVQAHLDVKGKMMIPIHWGAFTLALHDWTDPIERITKVAKDQGVTIATPKIGETVIVGSADFPSSAWWR